MAYTLIEDVVQFTLYHKSFIGDFVALEGWKRN